MITIHHLNNSRSQRILWLLEELQAPYEIVKYQRLPPPMPLAPPVTMATLFMNINAKNHKGQRISSGFYLQKQENVNRFRALFNANAVTADAGPQSKGLKRLYSFLADNL